jgi:tight adherence protein B
VIALAVLAVGLLLVRPPQRGRLARPPSSVGLGPLERWLAPRLAAADIEPPAGSAVLAALAGVTTVGLVAGGPVLAVLALLAAGGATVVTLSLLDGRRDARLERELPALLEAVARSLRSGAAIPVALREAATSGSLAAEDLAAVLAEVDRGRPMAVALYRWAAGRPRPGVRLVVGALRVALASGGTPARAVDGVAATLRERAEVDREVQALATQARISAVVITVAPLAFAALGVLGDEHTATFLLRTPRGLACLAAGVALDACGAWWMARLAGRTT